MFAAGLDFKGLWGHLGLQSLAPTETRLGFQRNRVPAADRDVRKPAAKTRFWVIFTLDEERGADLLFLFLTGE